MILRKMSDRCHEKASAEYNIMNQIYSGSGVYEKGLWLCSFLDRGRHDHHDAAFGDCLGRDTDGDMSGGRV